MTGNARSGTLTITTMSIDTNRMAVRAAHDNDATMGELGGNPDGVKARPGVGEMERKADAVETIKRHEK